MAFDWHAITGSVRPHQEEDSDLAGALELLEDPLGVNTLEASWQPARFGPKRETLKPDSVFAGDFVIIRANSNDDDTSTFDLGVKDHNGLIPLWLCKARPWHVHHRRCAQPVTSQAHLDV